MKAPPHKRRNYFYENLYFVRFCIDPFEYHIYDEWDFYGKDDKDGLTGGPERSMPPVFASYIK